MAARRLVILMVVLLAVSTIAAVLAPEPDQDDEEQATTTERATEAPPVAGGTGGELVRATIDADAEEPRTIEVENGDQVALVVRTKEPAQIEIPGFGLLEDAERDAPARFDLLAERDGRFGVRATTFDEPNRLIGTIAVGDGAAAEPAPGF